MTGAGSAAGVDAGNKEGRDNAHPRAQEKNLTGLPLRLVSAHKQIVETFSGFAVTAALAAGWDEAATEALEAGCEQPARPRSVRPPRDRPVRFRNVRRDCNFDM